MITRFLVLSIFGFLSSAIFASDDISDGSSAIDNYDLLMVNNPRQERRGDRKDDRDDKQDCRQEEGRVADDKRDCKQENRGEGDDEAEAESDSNA